jgi:hypothetical protein
MTGSMPRPDTARSNAFAVPTMPPRSSTRRLVEARTPPAEYVPPPREPDMTMLSNSVEARLYPKVEEFAMLSEIVASRVAFAFRPAKPAFSEEEIVIDTAFLQVDAAMCPQPASSRLTPA